MNKTFSENDFRIEGNVFDILRTGTRAADKSVTGTTKAVGQSFSGVVGQFSGFFAEWKYTIIFFIILVVGAVIFAAWISAPPAPSSSGYSPIILPYPMMQQPTMQPTMMQQPTMQQ